jgi:hypothetical protein
MKKPMRKVKKFETGGPATDEYKGTDEIVKYRMGQIKDPGVDLFKLARGEEQVAKPVPLDKKAEAAPTPAKTTAEPVKTEVKTTSEDIVDETGTKSKFKRNPETGDLYTPIENMEKSVVKTTKPAASSSSTSSTKPAAKVETKTETKTESKAEPKDDKPVPVKVDKETKPASKKYKSPGITDLTGTGTSDEERSDNVSKLLKGVKSIFSGPADYITKGSPKMRAKEALKSGMESKDRDAMRKGGSVKMASGGKVKSASARADGCAIRGKTRA